MIIDSEKEYLKFLSENKSSDLVLECIGTDANKHPAMDLPCLLHVKNVDTFQNYTICMGHPDGSFVVDKFKLIVDLNLMSGKKWVFDKKIFMHLLNVENLTINDLYDYNLIEFFETGDVSDYSIHNTKAHSFFKNVESDVNCIIPMTMHNETFDRKSDIIANKVKSIRIDPAYTKINSIMIENLKAIESNGIKINPDVFNKFFASKNVKIKDNFVYTEYNLYTSTGRPSNRFGGINYAALEQDTGCRASFISRHGKEGKLFMVDYSAYHPHLIAQLINYKLPADAYNYLGKFYLNKDELTLDEIKAAKKTTFQCIYGIIPEKYKNIPFFSKINNYINNRWQFFLENGYVETPVFKRQITNLNIKDPNPTKLFNYILQASETEYNMEMLSLINTYLCLYKKLTRPILYTYDSVLFDMYANDGIETFKQIKKLMNLDGKFPVKCYAGDNYDQMSIISI